jgi:hypothetical protein
MSMSWLNEIKDHSNKKYSQYGEEGYLRFIFENVGVKDGFFVDLGANDGKYLSNTRYFKEHGWSGILIDGQEFKGVHRHYITAENINELLKRYGVQNEFDLLSIDIDGNDYWVLRKILSCFRPRLIISEYNSEFTDARTIEYDPTFHFRATDYYGYTFEAGLKLAEEFGYRVIFQNCNLNMYYLRKDLLEDPEMEIQVPHEMEERWRLNDGAYQGKVDDRLKWVII